MSSSCGLPRPSSKSSFKSTTSTPPTPSSGSSKRGKRPTRDDVKAENAKQRSRNHSFSSESSSSLKYERSSEKISQLQLPTNNNNPRRRSADLQWAREDQLSVILENLESENRSTPIWEQQDPFRQHTTHSAVQKPSTSLIPETLGQPHPQTPPRTLKYNKIGAKERAYRIPAYNHNRPSTKQSQQSLLSLNEMSISENKGGETPETPRPIPHPPKDLESIARIDASLVFEHFTTHDAWVLGSALRERLLPIPTPVVIDISLANANQVLFHCCTHSGTMPDNDSWVSRKRKTVLRWGVSTWYMSCKFDGDEAAFRDKYGLGNSVGEYAIHGGGVPIRVTGVEGVVAVVVVSGLKQNEDHGVIVEVIKDLYY